MVGLDRALQRARVLAHQMHHVRIHGNVVVQRAQRAAVDFQLDCLKVDFCREEPVFGFWELLARLRGNLVIWRYCDLLIILIENRQIK